MKTLACTANISTSCFASASWVAANYLQCLVPISSWSKRVVVVVKGPVLRPKVRRANQTNNGILKYRTAG